MNEQPVVPANGTVEARNSASDTSEKESIAKPPSGWQKVGKVSLFLFGILLPLGTIIFEAITGMCADTFFDPIPSIAHACIALLVPSANFLAWLALRKKWHADNLTIVQSLGILNGAAMAIALYYTILFLPILPMAAIALIFAILGFGLLGFFPMAPLFSLVCAISFRRAIKTKLLHGKPLPGLWRGVLLGVFLLFAVSAPEIATRAGLRMAVSENHATSVRGIQWLRSMGNEDILLRTCYRVRSRPIDLASWVMFFNSSLTTDKARDIYYRVTGKSFNTKPVPSFRSIRGERWSGTDEFDMDPELGGEVVAGRLKGLTLADSRIDGSVDPDAALAYLEWTMVFRNDYNWEREARSQILLPPGAVISRLTLWIDGEEREAAFGGRSQVRETYRSVVQQRRDPVVVTTAGPDRVFVQCFPVPRNGGEMKIRIGITAPIVLAKKDKGTLLLPRILERNFKIKANISHSVWIESHSELAFDQLPLQLDRNESQVFTLRGKITDKELNNHGGVISVFREPTRRIAWALDNTKIDTAVELADSDNTANNIDEAQTIVWQKLETFSPVPLDRMVVVIDASLGMEKYLGQIATSIENFPTDMELAVLAAWDELIEISSVEKSRSNSRIIAEKIKSLQCAGGQDNTAALMRAWDLAAQAENGAILWIHNPQYYLLSAGESLRQALERRPNHPILYEMQTDHGPSRLIEKLSGLNPVKRVVRRGELKDDIDRLIQLWTGKTEKWRAQRGRGSYADVISNLEFSHVKESSRHLVRLWAYNTVLDDLATTNKTRIEAAKKRGILYQLVTPITGAVVLENQQQYDQVGLQPVDPGSVPTIPEPEHWVMIIMALTLAACALYRQRQRMNQA